MDYIAGMRNAAEIAAWIAGEHARCSNTSDSDAKLTHMDKQAAALEVQAGILKALDETKVIIYKCPCGVEHINKIGPWGFRDGEPYPIAGECDKCGGPVFHRPGNPGEYDHECKSPNDRTETPPNCGVRKP